MKKRCNIYVEEDNVEYLHENGKNISQLTDRILSIYVELMKMSENELLDMMNDLNNEINEKRMQLKMVEKRIIELADEGYDE